jgi:hypothetical protein
MLKSLLIAAAVLTYAPSAHAACIGYQNNMDALEAVMAEHKNTKPKTYKSTPPTASINQSLTALEKAMKTHKAQKTPQSALKNAP